MWLEALGELSFSEDVVRWHHIWQILPKITVFQKICQFFFRNIFYAKTFPFFEILCVSIDKTIHFGLFLK